MEREKLNKLSRPLSHEQRRRGPHAVPPGTPRRVTIVLKDAILYAAQKVGADGKGLDGLVGYLTRLARNDPKTFAGLLARVIPLHIKSEHEEVRYKSIDEVQAELRARGIPIERIFIPDDDSVQ